MKSPKSSKDTAGLGYTSNEEGESSKAAEERNSKGENSKSTYYYCGKGHTSNVCRSKKTNDNAKSKFKAYCQKCKKKKSKTLNWSRNQKLY